MLTRSTVALFVALASLAAAACEQVPLLAPSESSITVSASTSTLPVGGSTEVTAFVSESSGTPVHNGTLVRFTTTLGRVEPAEVETRGGSATATFIAGNASGVAEIRATSGGATGGEGATPTNAVSIRVGAAAANSVVLTASPSRVPASGGTITLIGSALDASGNRLTGVPVTFSSDAGTLSATVAVTDSAGEARVSLTTNREAKVTAHAGDKTSAVFTVGVSTATSIVLATSPATPLAGTPVTLNIKPAAGTSPRVVIEWGDGRSNDIGVVAAERNVTHVYESSGSYTISATATGDGDVFTNAVSVAIGSAAAGLRVEVSPAIPVAGSPVTLNVTPATGTTPRVVIEWGDGTTDDLGTVTGSRAVSHTYAAAGSYALTATATAGGDTFTTSTSVNVSTRPAININVTDNRGGSPQRCQSVTFTAAIQPVGEPISSYEWQVSSEASPVTTTGNQLARIFNTIGTKTVSVSAVTPDGRRGNGQTQVSVVPESTVVCPP